MTTQPPDRLFRPVSPAAQAKGERVFCAAVALLLVLSEVFSSNIQNTLPTFSHVCRIALTVTAAVLLVAKSLLLTRWQTKQQALTAAALAAFAVFTTAYGHDQWFCLPFCLALVPRMLICAGCCRSTLPQRLAGCWRCSCCTPQRRWCPTCTTAATGITAMAITTGTVPGWPVCFCLGLAALAAPALVGLGRLGCPGSLHAAGARLPRGRHCHGAAAGFVFAAACLARLFESRIWHGMALAAAPLALGFSLLAGRLFDPDHPTATPLLDKLNGLLSGRFEIWHHVFWGYPLYHPEQDGVPGWYHDAMPKAVTLWVALPLMETSTTPLITLSLPSR